MYLAKRKNNFNIPLYRTIFNNLANGESIDDKSDIDNALIEASEIENGEKDIFSATEEYFFLVTFLLSKGKPLLKTLGDSKIEKATYESVARLLES